MIKMKFRSGAKSTITGQRPVKTKANAPVTIVAKWLYAYPIINLKNSFFIIVMPIIRK